jgi:cobalt-zinc-cadmium efflux system protein
MHHHHGEEGHSGCSGHGHSHTPDVGPDNERKVLTAFFIIFAFMIVEVAGGILSGSLALLADAGHMLTDAVALGLAYTAFRFGRRAADNRRTFGYLRFEVVAGLINALTLFAIVGWIIYEAAGRLQRPEPILAGPMLAVAVIGMLVNLFVLWQLTRGDTEHVNIKGAILHVIGDLLGSAGAIVAAVVIWYTGWLPIDPILSVVVSLLILRSAWTLLRRTLHILLEGAPHGIDTADIAAHLSKTVDGVEKVGHVHVWLITSGRTLATLHVQPRPGADIPAMVWAVERELNTASGIEHPTVGIDWDGTSACSLEAAPKSHDQGHHHAR